MGCGASTQAEEEQTNTQAPQAEPAKPVEGAKPAGETAKGSGLDDVKSEIQQNVQRRAQEAPAAQKTDVRAEIQASVAKRAAEEKAAAEKAAPAAEEAAPAPAAEEAAPAAEEAA